MIFLSQERVAQMILLSFVYGCVFGVIMDAIRLVRLIISPTCRDGGRYKLQHIAVIVFNLVTDFLFVFSFALCAVIFTYNMSGGVFRGVVYVMMAAGLAVYSVSLHRLTEKTNAWVSKKTKPVLLKMFCIVSLPFVKIKKLLIKLYTLTIGKKIDKIKKGVKEEKSEANEPDGIPLSYEKGYKKEGRISLGGKGTR